MTRLAIPSNVFVFLPFGPRKLMDAFRTSLTPFNVDKHVGVTSVRGLDAANGPGVVLFAGDIDGLSYRQEMRHLDVAARLASSDTAAGWSILSPYCGPAGYMQPKAPDYCMLAQMPAGDDRLVFVPGRMVPHGSTYPLCPGETIDHQDNDGTAVGGPHLVMWSAMSFDRRARRWTDHGKMPKDAPPSPHYLGQDTWCHVYDPPSGRHVKMVLGSRLLWSTDLTHWTLMSTGLSLAPMQKSWWAHDVAGRRVFMVDPDRAKLFVLNLESLIFTNLGPIPGDDEIDTDGTRGYCFWDPLVHGLLVHRYDGPRESHVAWLDDGPLRWMPLPHVNEGIPTSLPISQQTVHYRGGCWNEDGEAFTLLAPGTDGRGPDGIFLLRLATGDIVIPPPPEETPMTATFNIPMADAQYPGGTPQPTGVRATATGPVTVTATAPWSPTDPLVTIPLQLVEGNYAGTVQLLASDVVLATQGPVNFIVPAEPPPPVTYRTPGGGFTVTVA